MIEPGVVISDRYRVIRLLGEGGMGAVFEAEHTGVGRKVALKVLHADFARKQDIVDRFEREARSAAAIGHDNIIDVLDFGKFEGAPYLVMEYLKGESLSDRIERSGKMSLEAASYIMGQMLSALGAAHAAGIVHRDLKPDNVYLINKAGLADFVKLLDFGIAKLKGDDGTGSKSKGLTQTGVLMGTPYYMAPEQALAKRDIDARADLYSAGVILYQMITGKLPFDAESQTELLMEIVYRPKGVATARSIDDAIPPEFDAIVMKAIAKEREDRYQDASEFSASLAPFMGSAPLAATFDGTGKFRAQGTPVVDSVTPVEWQKTARSTQSDGTRQDVPTPISAQRRSSPMGIVIGASLVVALGAGGVFYASRSSSNAAQPVLAARAAPTAAQSAPTTPIADPTVTIDLEQVPAEASVTVDGQPTSSAHLRFDRGSTHRLRVSAPGRQDFEETLVADRDRSFVIAPLAPNAPSAPVVPTAPDAGAQANNAAPIAHHGAHAPAHHASGPAAPAAPTGGTHPTPGNPLLPVSNEF